MARARFQELADVQPTLVLAGSNLVYVGRALELSPHRIAVTTIALALEAPFELDLENTGSYRVSACAVIPARLVHHLRASGTMAFVYTGRFALDPSGALHEEAAAVAARIARSENGPAQGLAHAAELVSLLGIAPPVVLPNISKALGATERSPYDIGTADRAAALAGLQTQAFRRSVLRQTGMTFGQHCMRARIHAAIRSLARGDTLTGAAHEAGFSSSAHLSTTVRRMFGLTPSTLKHTGVRIFTDQNFVS